MSKIFSDKLVFALAVYGIALVSGWAQSPVPTTSAIESSHGPLQHLPDLHFVRSFASAKDFGPRHPILNRTLDIIAGPADPSAYVGALQGPSAVSTDSHHRVFVADSRARAVHIFDFDRSRYHILDSQEERLGRPVALAVDAEDNVYVSDEDSRTILVYSSAGKFRHRLGQLQGGEGYFESLGGIAVDRTTGTLFICDTRRNMVVMMDQRGRLIGRIGRRGGGDQPGNFRSPTQAFVANGDLFVMDAGNRRVQILDLKGHFRRAIQLPYADRQSGLAVDRNNDVYVTNSVLNAIQVFPHEGGRPSRLDMSKTGAGELTNPTALWISSDECLYIVDSGEHALVAVFEIGADNTSGCRENRLFTR